MATSHVDLFPEHVFLPGDPISEESGLREARTHLTLHAIMLRAHAMAKESWGDCKPSTGGWGNCKASLEQSMPSTGQSRPSMGPRRATCAECAPSTDGIPRTRPTMGTHRLSVGSRRPTMGGRKSSTSSYPTNGGSYPLNEIHEKIARWGVKTHLQDDDEAVLPLLPSPEAFGEDMDPFDAAFNAFGGNESSEAGENLGDAGEKSCPSKASKETPNPFEKGATDADSSRDASETDSSALSDGSTSGDSGSTSRESSPPPLYTSRRSWWKRVISCEALMHRRLRYNQL